MVYGKLATVTADGSATSLDTGTFDVYTNLYFQLYVIAGGAGNSNQITFNDITATDYYYRKMEDGGSDTTTSSQTAIQIGEENNRTCYVFGYVTNSANKDKQTLSYAERTMASGASNAPQRSILNGVWDNTDQVTSIQYRAEGDTITSGCELSVFGSN